MSSATVRFPDTQQAKSLTDLLQTKLRNPATSPEFDFHSAVDQVLSDVGLAAQDSAGKLTFYGHDPIVLASGACLLIVVSFAAGFIPAHRASRIDPMRALRYE